MLTWLQLWWPALLAPAVPLVFNVLAGALHDGMVAALERRGRRQLPSSAGAWLAAELERRGLHDRVRVIASYHPENMYFVRRRVIHLADRTYAGRSAASWAAAAHELGHARFALEHPAAAGVLRAVEWLGLGARHAGLALVFGNLLYALPDVRAHAFACLAAAAALYLGRVAGELIASASAIAMLRDAGVLTRRDLAIAAATLGLALATYLAILAGHGFLLTQWWIVDRVTGEGRAASSGMTVAGWAGAAIASGVLAIDLTTQLWTTLFARPDRRAPAWEQLVSAAAALAVPTLVFLCWDHAATPQYVACVLVGMVPIGSALANLVTTPATALARLIRAPLACLVRRIANDRAWSAASAGLARTIEAGGAVLAHMVADPRRAALRRHLGLALRFLIVPLLLAFWFG